MVYAGTKYVGKMGVRSVQGPREFCAFKNDLTKFLNSAKYRYVFVTIYEETILNYLPESGSAVNVCGPETSAVFENLVRTGTVPVRYHTADLTGIIYFAVPHLKLPVHKRRTYGCTYRTYGR